MKKLYFLDEEEKNRILNLHESVSKKQYLTEDKVSDYWKTLDPTTSGKFAKINGAVNRPGTDEESFVKGIESLTKVDFDKLEELLKTIGIAGYKSVQDMINGELGYDDLPDVIKIRTHLSKLGITSTYKFREKDKYGTKLVNPTFVDKSFVIGGPKQVVKQPEVKTDVKQKSVVNSNKVNKTKVNAQQQLSLRLKQTQISLGLPESGALDNATLQAMITKLSPRPQVQPFTSGQPADIKPLSSSSPTAGINTNQLDNIN